MSTFFKRFSIHVFLPLFAGITIYILFRQIPLIDPHAELFPVLKSTVPEWLKYNVIDGLWFYAFISAIAAIWNYQLSVSSLVWAGIAMIVSIILEYMQSLHIVPGVFDWIDLLAYLVAASVFLLVCFFRSKPITLKSLYHETI